MNTAKAIRTGYTAIIILIFLTSGCLRSHTHDPSDGGPEDASNTEDADGIDSSAGSGGPHDSSNIGGDSEASDSSNGNGDGDAATPSDNITFHGRLENIISALPISGYVVKALDNSDLSELGVQATTDADGSFTLTGLPSGEVCLLAVGQTGEDEQVDSYTHGVRTDQQYRTIYSMPFNIAESIDAALCGDWRTDLGSVMGKVMYRTEEGEEYPVGCATIEVEEANKDTIVYYFDGSIPSVGDQSDPTCTEVGSGRIMETSSGGSFYAINLPVGVVRLIAIVEGQVIGSTTLTITAPEESTGGQYNYNSTRIYADSLGNPAPDCAVR